MSVPMYTTEQGYRQNPAAHCGEVPKAIGRRWRSIVYGLAGMLAVALAGATMGYNSGRVECVLVESPATVSAGANALARFQLTNATGRTVRLRPRSNPCWRTRLSAVPLELRPGERREIELVAITGGLNGVNRFVAAISTDATPSVITMAADVKVNADWVVRRVALGVLPAGVKILKRLKLNNIPAERLVRVGNSSDDNWSVRVVSAVGRSIEIELTRELPPTDSMGPAFEASRRAACDFSLYFSDADVRRLQVLVAASVAEEAVRPLAAP